MEAHDRTEKLSASPPLFKSEFLNFFSRVHPAVPAVVFVPVVVAMEWLGVDRGYAAWQLILLTAGRDRDLDADRVLAAPARLPLGARQRLRPPHALHHPRHPPRPSQRQDAAGDAAVGLDPPGGALLLLAFWLIFGDAAFPIFGGFIFGYLVYDYTHYYVHHFVPKSDLGKQLREQHMRHHFQDHRFGYGVSSPLWDVVFRTCRASATTTGGCRTAHHVGTLRAQGDARPRDKCSLDYE